MKPSVGIASSCTAAMLVAGGCGHAGPGGSQTGSIGAALPATSGEASSVTGGRGISVASARQALQTAGAAVPGGRPFDLETGSDEGQRVLEVKVASQGEEFKVVVAADGQQVVRQQQADKPSDDVAKVERAKVDARRALQAAAGTDPGSTLSEIEIDTNYDGAVVWQVALVHRDGSTLQIDVDAKSAAISAR
ncbi:PepSY domain-containing protein [Mycobacteroides abscessus subsp. massiliense]|uniref:PepSY domain-containing protein n=1 Tax=Mycobacteroides abscessus TaxID=36809 RepID=UPI000C263609|nr:PepSY domain-containing protein [Mycobacteroides abscessus]